MSETVLSLSAPSLSRPSFIMPRHVCVDLDAGVEKAIALIDQQARLGARAREVSRNLLPVYPCGSLIHRHTHAVVAPYMKNSPSLQAVKHDHTHFVPPRAAKSSRRDWCR